VWKVIATHYTYTLLKTHNAAHQSDQRYIKNNGEDWCTMQQGRLIIKHDGAAIESISREDWCTMQQGRLIIKHDGTARERENS